MPFPQHDTTKAASCQITPKHVPGTTRPWPGNVKTFLLCSTLGDNENRGEPPLRWCTAVPQSQPISPHSLGGTRLRRNTTLTLVFCLMRVSCQTGKGPRPGHPGPHWKSDLCACRGLTGRVIVLILILGGDPELKTGLCEERKPTVAPQPAIGAQGNR